MKITDKLIKEISALAKLEFDEKSAELMKADLEKIIGFVDKLSEIDTEGVEPLIYLNEEVNILREDKIKAVITQLDALKNAPQKDSDYFKVPTVLKK
ncbi:MAG: Asp-tRNA(Asn)/Glu-tRNA(Gln) amidotransferase subunit GatC [Flavobacteriales bacterium]|nr:Asp-tRNA(Asn)/Glu-tRNA(Gln) amidotransferase subunit GatC [Flavobacteriales bacterium]